MLLLLLPSPYCCCGPHDSNICAAVTLSLKLTCCRAAFWHGPTTVTPCSSACHRNVLLPSTTYPHRLLGCCPAGTPLLLLLLLLLLLCCHPPVTDTVLSILFCCCHLSTTDVSPPVTVLLCCNVTDPHCCAGCCTSSCTSPAAIV